MRRIVQPILTLTAFLIAFLAAANTPSPPANSPPAPSAKLPQANDPSRMRPGFYQLKTKSGIVDGVNQSDSPTIIRMCFTQAMIDKSNPLNGQFGACAPKVTQRGNQTRSEVSCLKDGINMTGGSVETVKGNIRTVVADFTTSDAHGAHTFHIDVEFTFLGADCDASHIPAPAP